MLRKSLTWPLMLSVALTFACDGGDPVDTGDTGDTGDTADTDDTGGTVTEVGDTIADAYVITPQFETATGVQDAINEPGDRDVYQIAQIQGNWYFAWADRPGTEADGSASGGAPDTVLHILAPDGTILATNDDMPYRYENTDAGMWWQATSNDPVYVEVIEWSQWRLDEGDSEPNLGGSNYVYNFAIWETDAAETVGENDTIQECFAGTSPSFSGLGLSARTMVYGHGLIDEPGDVDVFQLGSELFTPTEGSELMCQFGFWPDQPSDLSPRVRLYWEDCTPVSDMDNGDCDGQGDDVILLGESTDPELTPTGDFLGEDAAVMGSIETGRYYVEVSSTDPEAGGPGQYYSLLYGCFNTTNFTKGNEPTSFEDSLDPSQADIVPLDNPNDAQVYFGRFYGSFEREDSNLDTFDAYAIVDGLGDGRYLQVSIEAGKVGSLAGDITMTLWRNNGGGSFDELTSVTGPDPAIENYELGADDFAMVVTLESDGAVQGPAASYYGLAVATAEMR